MATHFLVKHPILHSEPGAKPVKLQRNHVLAAETLSERDQKALLKSGAIVPHTPAAEDATDELQPSQEMQDLVAGLKTLAEISKCTKQQLIDYANETFGAEISGTKEELVAKVQALTSAAIDEAAAKLPDTGAEG